MTLGSVGKASTDQFAGARKLMLVPLVMAVHDESEFVELVNRYWNEAGQQVRNLESGLGRIAHVFHEGTVDEGEAGLTALERGAAPSFPLVKEVWGRGAQVQAVEETETLLETLDLQRCLLVAQASTTVGQRLYEWYTAARKRRYETMIQRIRGALQEDEVGLLVIGQDHQLQFPPDIQVFYVAPPSLNDIDRWLRDHPGPQQPSESDGATSASGQSEGREADDEGQGEEAST
jgi:hypothetical protein